MNNVRKKYLKNIYGNMTENMVDNKVSMYNLANIQTVHIQTIKYKPAKKRKHPVRFKRVKKKIIKCESNNQKYYGSSLDNRHCLKKIDKS